MLTSVEANDELGRTWKDDADAAERLDQEINDSMVAHDYLGTEWALSPETNLVRVTSGVGDGGYPVYVGFDTDGNPTGSSSTSCSCTLAGPAPETHSAAAARSRGPLALEKNVI